MRRKWRQPTATIWEELPFLIGILIYAGIVLAFVLLLPAILRAADNGQYTQIDPATRDWFRSLRGNNGNGILCCDLADGRTLLDPEWECKSETECAVKMDGDWVTVPPEAIIHPKDRPASIGFAVVWAWNGKVICFLAGTQT